MTHHIVIQHAAAKPAVIPSDELLREWAAFALGEDNPNAELTIRIVDTDEITTLNEQYRRKKGPTNVLSFPLDVPIEVELYELGDIVICAQVVNDEAKAQAKPDNAHWAHMVIHGVLHLLGYDHVQDDEAEVMESIEVNLLNQLGYANPYENGESIQQYE